VTDSFDNDFGVDQHGHNVLSAFINNRADEAIGSAWSYLDLTLLSRQEAWEDSPEGYLRPPMDQQTARGSS
jgi:predicted dithiol-disulfide oxidoreductase (DUF899 family)